MLERTLKVINRRMRGLHSRSFLQRAPGSRFRSDAYRALYVSDRGAGNMAGALQWAERWSGVAPVQEKFEALMYVAELRKANGDLAGARTAAQESLVAVKAFDNAMQADSLVLTPAQTLPAARSLPLRRSARRGRCSSREAPQLSGTSGLRPHKSRPIAP